MGIKKVKIKCAYCGKQVEKNLGHYNRAKKIGAPVYCDKKCAGLGRRKNYTDEEKKKIKSDYDKKRRRLEWMPLYEAFNFHLDYAAKPEKYKAIRKAKYKKHLQYLSTPEYKKWKKKYDQKYCAKKNYGEFAEAAIALRQLAGIVDNRDAKRQQTNINKSQKRKRNANKNVKRKELESCSVGFYQPS